MTREADDRIPSNKHELQSNKWTNRSAHATFWGFEELGGADLGFGGLGVCVLELWRVSNKEQQVGVVGGWKSKF